MAADSEQLRDQIATIAQREFENSLTTLGTVAFRDHLGDRIAVEVMRWVVDAALADAVAAGRRQAAADALRDMADRIDRGPAIPLPPSVYSALIRERAADITEAAPAEPVEEADRG